MYELRSTESYFAAQSNDQVSEAAVGGLLREVALQNPTAEALLGRDIEYKTTGVVTVLYRELLTARESLHSHWRQLTRKVSGYGYGLLILLNGC